MPSDEFEPITPQAIIDLVKEQVILPAGEWDKVERKVENMLAVIWQIDLETELDES